MLVANQSQRAKNSTAPKPHSKLIFLPPFHILIRYNNYQPYDYGDCMLIDTLVVDQDLRTKETNSGTRAIEPDATALEIALPAETTVEAPVVNGARAWSWQRN